MSQKIEHKGMHQITPKTLNRVQPLPSVAEPVVLKEDSWEPAKTREEFFDAVQRAHAEERDWLEVTDEVFKMLVRNQKTNYLTYDSPGIKVFRVGTRDQILKEEAMTPEAYSSYIASKRAAGQEV